MQVWALKQWGFGGRPWRLGLVVGLYQACCWVGSFSSAENEDRDTQRVGLRSGWT
jgi:hypothetical protein